MPQLSLALEPEAPERIAPPIVSGQYDSAASVTSIALFADCPRRYYLARYLGWEPVVDSGEFGKQVHGLLAGGPREGLPEDAQALADQFESSDLGRRVATATPVEREFDFLLAIEDVVLRGQIDLWFEDVIVDYKTDNVSPEEAQSRAQAYELQLQLYAVAVERLSGKPPDRALLYFLRPNVIVPVDVSRTSLDTAVEQVRAFRRAQDSQLFPLHEGEHCLRCPFFRGMCPQTFAGARSCRVADSQRERLRRWARKTVRQPWQPSDLTNPPHLRAGRNQV